VHVPDVKATQVDIDPRVLFLHPYNHMEPDAVPVGAVGLVNLLPGKALGRFASEVTSGELAAARVILIDAHWFFPLGILEGMVTALRRVNPSARIVVGGIASAFYAEIFFERYPVDYVLTGDVETVFATLVGHLLAGEEPPPLPGVWSASTPGRSPPDGARIRAAEFDAIDWLTIDWFPSYRATMLALHARYRAQIGDSAPLCYPYLPVTRGCRRACSFCYGSYHDRVFGRGIRMRDPEVLLRDLRAIEAAPELAFVSILFADEGLMAPYAPMLEGKHLQLDAFLYFCGNADPDVLEQVRSGFAGTVNFSVIQAPDLESLPSDPSRAVQQQGLSALVARIDGMERTGARFYHLHAPAAPEVTARDRPGSSIQSDWGIDWEVIRPDMTQLRNGGDEELREQLGQVVAAARSASALHVARLLVPTLRSVLDTKRYREDVFRERDGGDPLATRILRTYRRALHTHRVYGFESVELALRASTTDGEARWARPGDAVDGRCVWTAGVHGFGWEGEVKVDAGGPSAVGPCPTLLAWDEAPIDLAAWPRTIVPVVPVPPGSSRTVRVGGRTEGTDLLLWLEDGGARVEHRLPHGLGLIEAEILAGRSEHWRGPEVAPECEARLWPAHTWPASVCAELRGRPVQAFTPALRLAHLKVEPTHLYLELRGGADVSIALVVFPREPGQRYLGSKRLAFAYRIRRGTMDLGELQRALARALDRADARMG
jgi:hypothetical protein